MTDNYDGHLVLRSWLRDIPVLLIIFGAAILIFALFGCSKSEARERHHHSHHIAYDANGNVIGGRPAGCPYQYCGCGLRLYLGLQDKALNLAWEWARKFRHTAAAPGMAAVRHHHVMLLLSQVSGSIWTVRDYNGGRHLSYIHDRDVRGYIFVDPRSRMASL